MKKDEMIEKIVENVNSPPAEGITKRSRRIFSRTRWATRRRWRTAWGGARNFALDARAIPI